jgi:hypothetical protein
MPHASKSNKINKVDIVSNNSKAQPALEFYKTKLDSNPNLINKMIYWYDNNNYIIPKNLDKAIQNKLSDKIMVLHVLIIGINFDHANTLIIDPKKKRIIHFEPYGDPNKIYTEFTTHMTKFFKKLLPSYKYHSSHSYANNKIFQAISNETDPLNTKHGDIGGFCMAWSLWFVELYIKNSNIDDLSVLVDSATKHILNSKYSFISYIRHYANDLRKFHIKYLNSIKYPAERIFNSNLTHSDQDFLYQNINKDIGLLMEK